jgi:hypothetical protein
VLFLEVRGIEGERWGPVFSAGMCERGQAEKYRDGDISNA